MVPSVVRDECQLSLLRIEFSQRIDGRFLYGGGELRHIERASITFCVQDRRLRSHRKLRMGRHQHSTCVQSTILYPFCTIHQRTTFHCHTPTIVSDFGIGHHGARFHVEVDAHHIALLPLTSDRHIALGIHRGSECLAIYRDGVGELLCIVVAIEVAWNHVATYPSRDAHHQREIRSTVLGDAQRDVTLPRILRSFLQRHILAPYLQGCCIGREEIHVQIPILHRIDIARHGRNEATEVAGTTGTAKPVLTGSGALGVELVHPIRAQRIRVEELTPIYAHATDHAIIKRAFQTVDVLRIAMQQKHTLIEVNLCNGRTSFIIRSKVRQFIIRPESLP